MKLSLIFVLCDSANRGLDVKFIDRHLRPFLLQFLVTSTDADWNGFATWIAKTMKITDFSKWQPTFATIGKPMYILFLIYEVNCFPGNLAYIKIVQKYFVSIYKYKTVFYFRLR